MWKNKIFRILILVLVVIIISVEKVYAVASEGLNIRIIEENIHSPTTDHISSLIDILQENFNYSGSEIKNQMRMETVITLEDVFEPELLGLGISTYTVRIRNRN